MATLCILAGEDTPDRTPIQGTLSITTEAKELSEAALGSSLIGWEIMSEGAWLWGTSEEQLRSVAALEPFPLPSRTLNTWFVKSASGTITLVISGAKERPKVDS
jgi:hypothetical protein